MRYLLIPLALLALASPSPSADAPAVPAGDKDPILRLEAGGPTAYVTALAFSPDGKRLYAAGWDKVVRVWVRDANGRFVLDRIAYRVPIGPGSEGEINAIAVSPDGAWLAVGGFGVFEGSAGFRRGGRSWKSTSYTAAMLRDMGTIYVFHTAKPLVRVLRGHTGWVHALAFAPAHPDKPPLLVSAARELDTETRTYRGKVRLWDVDKAAAVDEGDELPDLQNRRPGLSVWHTGQALKQVRVALACYDQRLRIWEPDRPRDRLRQVEEVRYLTAAYLPDRERLLTAGSGEGQARLKLWDVSGDDGPTAEWQQEAPKRIDSLPRALGLVSARGDGTPDHAVVILRNPAQGNEYDLQVIDLGKDNFGKIKAFLELWKGTDKQPVLATAPQGEHVAVAGNDDHSILVFRVADLLQNRNRPQRLRSAGTNMRYVSFVTDGKELGLLMSETARASGARQPPARPGDVILDFSRRRLTGDLAGWKTAAPAMGEWSVTLTMAEKRSVLTVKQGEKSVKRIELTADQALTDFALLPPQKPLNVPILAVALLDIGQPVLYLYNAATGERLRQCHGHEGTIHALAFSRDGRLLASAAEDETVSVWSLTDLHRLIGKRGWVHGLTVRLRGKELTVNQVQAGPAQGKLAKGETVLGIVGKNGLRSFARELLFYEAIDVMRPGSDVTLSVRGANGVNRNVTLRVGQLIDERKPLLSLFVSRAAKAEDREWIGWSPVGPYESSRLKAERHLGWHRNTGAPAEPTRFAPAEEYRKKYYREGILKALVAAGDLSQVPPPPPPPPPRMGMVIEAGGRIRQPDGQGQVLVRQPAVMLKLLVLGRPLDTLKALAWQIDGGAEQPLAVPPNGSADWSVPLRLARGVYTLRFIARSTDTPAEEYTSDLQVRYQPPPPVIEYTGNRPKNGAPLVVRQPAFDVRAAFTPGVAGEEVRVGIRHRHKDKDLLNETQTYRGDAAKPQTIERRLQLATGYNRVEIVATNRDAPKEFADFETARLTLEISYVERAKPPVISLRGLVGVPPGADQPAEQKLDPTRPIIVADPRVKLLGEITADESVTQATWSLASGARKAFAGFEPKPRCAIAEELRLRPGKQTIHFHAKTDSSDEAERALEVEYRPPLPAVVIEEPSPNQPIYGEAERGHVRLRARLDYRGERQPLTAKIIVNGQEITEAASLDPAGEALTADVALRPRGNRVQVQLTNAWGGVAATEPVAVTYLRPPRVLAVEDLTPGNQPRRELRARVRSPLPLIPETVEVRVNGRERQVEAVFPEKPDADYTWRVRLKGVPLDAGRVANDVRFWVGNAEARCREPGAVQVQRPNAKELRAEILDPALDGTVTKRETTIRVRVRSASALKQVQLVLQGEKSVRRLPLDVKPPAADADGMVEWKQDVAVALFPGLNRLVVEAESADGRQTSPTRGLTYLSKPARLVIDHIIPKEPGAHPIRPVSAGPEFPDIPAGRVRLHGRVRWGDDGPSAAGVRVFVNGFQQLPALLAAAKSQAADESSFEADLLLNRPVNQVALAVRQGDGGQVLKFDLRCSRPDAGQRMHLLVLSVREPGGDSLEQDLEGALRCKPDGQGSLAAPAFKPVIPYGPLIGYNVRRENLNYQLYTITTTIKRLAQAGDFGNDVVLLYYQGGEAFADQGHFFQSHASGRGAALKSSAIDCQELVDFFADTPGAHVLLLDVDRRAAAKPQAAGARLDRVAEWAELFEVRSHVVVLRYAWLGVPAVPKDVRLIAALEQALPQRSRLKPVADFTAEFADQFRRRHPDELLFDRYLPAGLDQLLVGSAGGAGSAR